jgi:hypothetical protein
MVTKGYQKGVYERVTKGITGGTGGLWPVIQKRYGAAEAVKCNLPAALAKGATFSLQKGPDEGIGKGTTFSRAVSGANVRAL